MKSFKTTTGKVIPLDRADVDTDQIIPAQHLKRIERTGFGQFAFEGWRQDPDFVLNDPAYQGAPIMVTGPNFGCGSSREHAPWALQDLGLDVIIAPSFADIFRNNCARIGLLAITLPPSDCEAVTALGKSGGELTVDLEAQTLKSADGSLDLRFEVDAFVKRCLLEGLDAIGLTLEHAGAIDAFEAKRPAYLPTNQTA